MVLKRYGRSSIATATAGICVVVLAACGGAASTESGETASTENTGIASAGSTDSTSTDGTDTTSTEDTGSASTGSTKTASFEDLSFVYASAADSIGLFKTVGDNMVRDAQELGIEMRRYDNDLDGQTALRNASLMVQDQPDVAIDWNTVVGVGTAVGNIFRQADIPCLAVNQQIPGCAWFNLSNKQIGIDAVDVIAPVAEERGWNGDNTTILLSTAPANGEEVNDGPRYFYVDMAKELPGFEQVSPSDITALTTTIGGDDGVKIDCKSTIQGAYTGTKNVLPSIPQDHNILLFGSDTDCTLGALRALEEAGYGERTLTCGLGATPEGLHQLRTNPAWLCEAALFLQEWSGYILAEAVAIANGVTPPDLTPAPQIMLTKDNVDEFYSGNDVIKLPPLVPGNQYLAETGVFQALGQVPGSE